jgi:N-glycosylase/DNA lyase
LEDFAGCKGAFWKKMFTRGTFFYRTFADEMEKTDRQKQARKLVSDYLGFLMDQEGLVRRVVDERLKEMQPKLEDLIDERIRKILSENST